MRGCKVIVGSPQLGIDSPVEFTGQSRPRHAWLVGRVFSWRNTSLIHLKMIRLNIYFCFRERKRGECHVSVYLFSLMRFLLFDWKKLHYLSTCLRSFRDWLQSFKNHRTFVNYLLMIEYQNSYSNGRVLLLRFKVVSLPPPPPHFTLYKKLEWKHRFKPFQFIWIKYTF